MLISGQKVLITDDEPFIRETFSRLLASAGHKCFTAASGDEALQLLETQDFRLMLCDINMPGMTGIELLHTVRKRYEDLAVIMITGVDDRDVGIHCLEAGAYGYVIKPLQRNELLINVANALHRRELEVANRRYSLELEELVEERTEELRLAREETINRLSRAAEFRDNETAQHTVRMSHYCKLLAMKISIPSYQCERIRIAAPLHDVGKIGISDTILLKPGALTPAEFERIKEHPEIGYRILVGSSSDLLRLGATIAYTHHEKFDGSGYPRGLAGLDIPIEGRIAAICDVFDALTSDRVYKKAIPVEKAVEIMSRERGSHFDPELLDSFLGEMEQVVRLKQEYADSAPKE